MNEGQLSTPLLPPPPPPPPPQNSKALTLRTVPQTQTSQCRGPERTRRTSYDCEFQRRAEWGPGSHGHVEQSDDTRGSLHSNYLGNRSRCRLWLGDLGWGLRLCISNMPAGSEVHRGTERKADPSQQAGRDACGSQAEALGESWQTGLAWATSIVCVLP